VLIAEAPAAEARAGAEPGGVRSMTAEEFQAGEAMQLWRDGLRALAEDAGRVEAHCLTSQTASDLVTELLTASRRLDLTGRLVGTLARSRYGLTIDRQARSAALICAEAINRFVTTLGQDATSPEQRPRAEAADGTEHPVFQPRPAARGIDSLPAEPRATAEAFWTDWVFALDAMFRENVRAVGGQTVNEVQNDRLGSILTRTKAIEP
jgi:hypothetical protein